MKTKNTFKNPLAKRLAVAFSVMLMAILALGITSLKKNVRVLAAGPTYILSGPATGKLGDEVTLTLKVDGSAGQLLGAETNITYDTDKVNVTQVNFGTCIFESCINLSETGTIKLLAASGPPPDGKTVDSNQTWATIKMELTGSGNAAFDFTKAQVINQSEQVETRGTSGYTIQINPVATGCGNGKKETGETCDDGNLVSGDGCSSTCQLETITCGNGIVEGTEECDDGNTKSNDGCSATCTIELSTCGNGTKEGAEQCDHGDKNGTSGDSCSATCTNVAETPVCGNGITEAGEQCDDGSSNGKAGDGCSATCENVIIPVGPVCGDGKQDAGEQCDDGNKTSGDGCSSSCQLEGMPTLTGISFSAGTSVHVGETIQLIATAHYSDGSSKNITSPSSNPGMGYSVSNGHGYISTTEGAPCSTCSHLYGVSVSGVAGVDVTATYTDPDTGISKSDTAKVTVLPASQAPEVTPPTEPKAPEAAAKSCGNGTVDMGEQCDDGNTATGDGCDAACAVESGYLCAGTAPSTCTSVAPTTALCGNGTVDPGEQCDNGTANGTEGNACDTGCQNVVIKPAAPEKPKPVCGNSKIEDGEYCDDGNTVSGDGCSATCTIEEKLHNSAPAVIITLPIPGDTRIADCQKKWPSLNFTSKSADADGDGLSNRTECYAKTDPTKMDTDGDGCSDGDETNLFSTDPNKKDCGLKEVAQTTVLITDPQADWTMRKLSTVSGIAPQTSQSVTVVAVPVTAEGETPGQPVLIGTATTFGTADLNGQNAKKFEITNAGDLKDGSAYDLLASAKMANGKTINSALVRLNLDSTVGVNAPVPRSIGEAVLNGGAPSAFHDVFFKDAVAAGPDGSAVAQIKTSQPTVVGDTDFGSQVFAVWNSVVLSSSVIADSEKGGFEIQAPRNLESNVQHRVTLYAVRTDASKKLRSDSVNVLFQITPAKFPLGLVLGAAAALLLATGSVFMIRRRMKMKMAQGPSGLNVRMPSMTLPEIQSMANAAPTLPTTPAATPGPSETPVQSSEATPPHSEPDAFQNK